ncbi:hypothetical protein [Bacillus thuringiensis]|uniref:hypothetical protein n=1 Tax=Bacillus thuringiensis TaxID=1428 RepID=UPI001A8DD8D3|nr:hypothetical protein [Bacillus thuringiensis]MDY7521583.1 hypothetical protein [Bacillus thuringiensis]
MKHPKEVKILKEIYLPQINVLDYLYDTEVEHLVRQASALLSHNYEIVTANVNDFMLYPFLYPQTAKFLYDLMQEQYVEIDPQLYERIQKDARFIDFKSKI